ncbi:MAG: glycosyltransferase family 2 protein [Candidatus Nanoarchaeia archaeon]|nr:glycosyltransferase family 2 protein [Candidatus Nanoarchaeia archaeon]
MKTSIIVPAYNEEKRIPVFLEELINYSKKNLDDFEILIVNDGSKDKTVDVVNEVIKKSKALKAKIIDYSPNKGKGHAVKTGVNDANGDVVVFIDADGSIKPEEIGVMVKYLKKYDVVIGNRKTASSKIDNPQPLSRRFASWCFNKYVSILLGVKVQDFLCGFKGFRKDVAKKVFSNIKTKRWTFDVEILNNSKKNNYTIFELPIEWAHKDDSKMRITDPIKIFFDVFKIRFL